MTTLRRKLELGALVIATAMLGCGEPPASVPPGTIPMVQARQGDLVVSTDALLPGREVTGDVDDVIALHLLYASGIEPVATVLTAGNGPARMIASTRRMLPIFGRVYAQGGHCSAPSIIAVVDALRKGPVIFLVLGPASEVAVAIRCAPEFHKRVAEVIFVGGRSPDEEFRLAGWVPRILRPMRDLNFELDREAIAFIVASGVPLTLVPFRAGNSVRLRPSDLAPHFDDRANAAFRNHAATLVPIGGNGRLPAFDPVAAAYYLWPSYFECDEVIVSAGEHLVVERGISDLWHSCEPRNPRQLREKILTQLR